MSVPKTEVAMSRWPRSWGNVEAEIGKRMGTGDRVANLIDAGLATWAGGVKGSSLIVKGQSQLLENIDTIEQLETVRRLFNVLEARDQMIELLDVTTDAQGVQIFIGSENKLFGGSGLSMVISPYQNAEGSIVGAIGVVGPTRINYARIIPLVDYTAKLVGRLIG